MKLPAFFSFSSLTAFVFACSGTHSVPGPGTDGTPYGTAGSDADAGRPGGVLSGAGGLSAGSPGASGAPIASGGTTPAAGAAGGAGAGGSSGGRPLVTEPGTQLDLSVPADVREEQARVSAALAETAALDREQFLAASTVPFAAPPEYSMVEPASLGGLPAIQASSLKLNTAELELLGQHGFVITDRHRFPSFIYGYQTIYMEDLPVYVSADSVLFAIHRSYDALLMRIESALLIPELEALLAGMRERLKSSSADERTRQDADVYLSVASSLLKGSGSPPVAGGDATLVYELLAKASQSVGAQSVELFGVQRDEDFSQFEPRGHYNDRGALARYFKAMMWLGRVDFRLIETKSDGSQVFHRRQLEAALLMRDLIDANLRKHFDRIDAVVTAFVGEHDYMQLGELDALMNDLGVSSATDLADIPDQRIAQAIVAGGYGRQRISSHIMVNGGVETLPLSSSFALLGQRYTIDSHVFSNVVYDRVANGTVYRMLPSPLDVAYAALKNDQAGQLLSSELETYAYAPALESLRVLTENHEPAFWGANLYNLWLGTIQSLSPNAQEIGDTNSGLPPAARSEAWGRRLLSTQLASWAELRHDTLLYAKQSYTAGATCEFPDAYVDPYPEFYRAVSRFAERGNELFAELGTTVGTGAVQQFWLDSAKKYFVELGAVAARLTSMAEHQRTGAPYTPEMLEFINQAVKIQQGCGSPAGAEGWYARLFVDPLAGLELDPTIADVHTQPTDELGNPVGKVLHVATGLPRLMVAVAEGCSGPRAYAGLASSYFERVTRDFERLQDEPWSAEIEAEHPEDPSWLRGIVAR